MAELVVENLVKRYGAVTAISDVSFRVKDGEFVTLLGPSGCGKSTTLAAVAGLDRPTEGRITVGETVFFDGASNQFLPAENRNCGLVFQSYALWPHMTVRDNVAFPLKLRKLSRAELDQRVRDALDLVEMGDFAGRYPHELSGGQQQRVALARTIVYRPSVLLLDEPLSNLDAKLRERARLWLGQLQQQVGLTTLYVTHDQSEALALSDRIVVMDKGNIVQIGTPHEIYEQPLDPFVADFIGTRSFVDGVIARSVAGVFDISVGSTVLRAASTRQLGQGDTVLVAIRPENLVPLVGREAPAGESGGTFEGEIASRTYLGTHYQYEVRAGETLIKMDTEIPLDAPRVAIWVPEASCSVFPRPRTS